MRVALLLSAGLLVMGSMAEADSSSSLQSAVGFDERLLLESLTIEPVEFFSPHVGSLAITGRASVEAAAGVDGDSAQHAFALQAAVQISGVDPVQPVVDTVLGTAMVTQSGPVDFGLSWSGLPGGATLPDGVYRLDLEASLVRSGPGASGRVLDTDTFAGPVFVYDATPPQGAWNVAAGAFLNVDRPLLAATYGDALAGIDTASLRIELDGADVTASFAVSAGEAVWTPAAPLAEGTHTLTFSVLDRAGNEAVVTTSFTIDITPPALSLTPATGTQLATQTPDLRAAYSDALAGIDAGSVAVSLDAVDATARFAISNSEVVWTQDAPLAYGDHTFTVSVADRAGNVASATVDFAIVAPYRYFTLDGGEIRFDVVNTYFLVKLADGVSPVAVGGDLAAAGASAIAQQPDPFGFYEVGVAAGSSVAGLQAAAKLIPGIAKVHPVVSWPDGRATGTADGVYVKFAAGTSDADARALLAQAGAVDVANDCCEPFAYLAAGSLTDASDDFLLADRLRAEPGVTYAAPALVIRYAESVGGVLDSSVTSTQGYLAQAGITQSRALVYGSADYLVSYEAAPIGLLSTGVQHAQPGLAGRLLDGYSAFGDTADLTGTDHVENSLGTAMAGVLAANWGTYGLEGVTKDSPLVPAKVRQYSCGEISGACFWVASDRGIKQGAKTVLDSGARVLLFDSRFAEYLPQTIAYLNAALPAAADNRGAVAVFPMGDEKHELYPYRAPTPLHIANAAFVTAIDENDRILERANVHDRDAAPTTINYAAPGSPVLTLDPVGAAGAAAGDTAVWQGTPMAAAIFAGSTALSFLIDDGLTAQEILDIYHQTGTLSVEEIERSPLFKFFLWKLTLLHANTLVEENLCLSTDASPAYGYIHRATLAGNLMTLPLPPNVRLTVQGSHTSTLAGYTLYKEKPGVGNPGQPRPLCAQFSWTGNTYVFLLPLDKRVVRFTPSTADIVKVRAGIRRGMNQTEADLLGVPRNDYFAYESDGLGVYYEAKPYSVFGTQQPYSAPAYLHMKNLAGAELDVAPSFLRVCARQCFLFLCRTKCSPGVSVLDTPDGDLTEAQVALKHAVLANESLAYEYRRLEADFDPNDPGFDERILTQDEAERLEAFRVELSASVGADLLLSAVGFFDNPLDRVGATYADLMH